MNLWSRWRGQRKARPLHAAAIPSSRQPKRAVDGVWLGEALQAVLAWLLPGSAAGVAMLGQAALALVLLALAAGVWLRLWRGRVNPGKTSPRKA